MAAIVFFIAAAGAIAGAVGTVVLRNPFYSVLSLVGHLLSLAALFLLLRAEFVAAAQVVVYAGAVMVLYIFVVAYVGGDQGALAAPVTRPTKVIAVLCVGALLVELCIATLGSGLTVLETEGTGFFAEFGTPKEIGRLFLTDFLLAFEVASMLLLLAAVGAVVIARRRTGHEGPTPHAEAISVADLFKTPGPGPGTASDAPAESQLEHHGPGGR